MNERELAREARKQARLEKLGSNNPHCGACGEDDWRCLERHHVADRKRDDLMVYVCRNCHRKVSDDQKGHPELNREAEPLQDRIGHFLLGLADLLWLIVERLEMFGLQLIAAASQAGRAAS